MNNFLHQLLNEKEQAMGQFKERAMKVKHRTVSTKQNSGAKKPPCDTRSELRDTKKSNKSSKQRQAKDFLSLSTTQSVRRSAESTNDLFVFTKIYPMKRKVPSFFSNDMSIIRKLYGSEIYGTSGELKTVLNHFQARDISFYYAPFKEDKVVRLFNIKALCDEGFRSARADLIFSSSEFYDKGDQLREKSGLFYTLSQGFGVKKDESTAEFLLGGLSSEQREITLTFSLSTAAREGDQPAAAYFLKAGANPNHPLIDSTIFPLSLAVKNKHSDIVELLLEAGADPHHVKNQYDYSPLEIADPHGPIREALMEASDRIKSFKMEKKESMASDVLKKSA